MDKSHLEWQVTEAGHTLFAGGQPIGSILRFDHDHISAEDEVSDEGEGLFRWTRTFAAQDPVNDVHLKLEFLVPRSMHYGMIPAISYNGNFWGQGQDPKGFITDGEARVFAYHRVAVSGGSYSESEDWSVALFAKEGFDGSCALVPADRQTLHQLLLPESETPQVYIGRDRYAPPYKGSLSLESGDNVSVTAFLLVKAVEKPRDAWRHMLDAAWEQHHYAHHPRHSCEELWNWAVQYAKEHLWAEKGIFRGFSLGLQWIDEQWTQHPTAKYEIGWCGQNASIANGLLYDYLRSGSQSSLTKGLAALDCWAEYAPLPNGLFRCHLDAKLITEATAHEVQDGCNLGAAAMHYFEAFELAAKCDIERPIYQTIALNICDFFVAHQFADGNLGCAWRNDGTCSSTDGATGGFMIPPLLMAFRLTGSEAYLETAKRAFAYYVRGLLDFGFTAAGALDTNCIDKESAIPLLRAGLMLYNLTNDAEYLDLAEHAAYYLASWQWHHTVSYPTGTALHALAYDTFGGTSVSTQHHHQDPYGLTFVPDWMRLAELTGKDIWHQRALAVWANGMVGVSDGQLVVMGKKRPVGSQDEGFYHTRWYHPFDVSQWLVAWPTAFRLEVLRRLTDWSVLA